MKGRVVAPVHLLEHQVTYLFFHSKNKIIFLCILAYMATWALIFQNKVWGFYPHKIFMASKP
jgi:hypothetical protein